ncbi:hypothetical protein [Paraliobacillus ryukyuensis]|uniref:hypothetical protein n=1 Tax=Paraliobacillus ryukyuensis TaxID=200904 RepID=UPI0009A6D941|nr:hypothetical protein [Paraliobacillus ryukyuensis]
MVTVFKNRRSELRIRDQLPNGKKVNLYFCRHRTDTEFYQWHIGFYIGDRKEANLWFNKHSKKQPSTIKGDGTIAALLWALGYIRGFVTQLEKNEELVIGWEDRKRKRAYKRLRKYGFVNYYDDEGNVSHLGIRNPEYWICKD